MDRISITKKPRVRQASFLNNFFTDGGHLFLENIPAVPL